MSKTKHPGIPGCLYIVSDRKAYSACSASMTAPK